MAGRPTDGLDQGTSARRKPSLSSGSPPGSPQAGPGPLAAGLPARRIPQAQVLNNLDRSISGSRVQVAHPPRSPPGNR